METRPVTLDLPLPLLARIEGLAHARRLSVGQLLRQELARGLGRLPGEIALPRDIAPPGHTAPPEDDDAVIDPTDTGPGGGPHMGPSP